MSKGFTLVELLVALALTAILALSLTQASARGCRTAGAMPWSRLHFMRYTLLGSSPRSARYPLNSADRSTRCIVLACPTGPRGSWSSAGTARYSGVCRQRDRCTVRRSDRIELQSDSSPARALRVRQRLRYATGAVAARHAPLSSAAAGGRGSARGTPRIGCCNADEAPHARLHPD